MRLTLLTEDTSGTADAWGCWDTAGIENRNWYRSLSVERILVGLSGMLGFAIAVAMTLAAVAEARAVPSTTWSAVAILDAFGVVGLWFASVALTRIPVSAATRSEAGIELTIRGRVLRLRDDEVTEIQRVVPYWRTYSRRDFAFDRRTVQEAGKVNPFLLIAARILTTRRRLFIPVSYVVTGQDAYDLLARARTSRTPPERAE